MEEVRWIEAEASCLQEENVDDLSTGDLFADPDPRETFMLQYGPHSITIDGVKAENGQLLSSTGLTLWRAAPLLCEYMLSNAANDIQGSNVLELGAGLGLCGILAHKLGANYVLLSDGDTETLREMRHNVKLATSNGGALPGTNIHCQQLVWGKRLKDFQEHYGTFDVILASDVIYVEEVLEPLFDTVTTLMKESGKFFLSYARRNVNIDLVFASATRHGLQWTQPDGPEGVFVIQRKM
jgi:predicted nicotinamide N-methyase